MMREEELQLSNGHETQTILQTWSQNTSQLCKILEDEFAQLEEVVRKFDLVELLADDRFSDAPLTGSTTPTLSSLVNSRGRTRWEIRKEGKFLDPFGILGAGQANVINGSGQTTGAIVNSELKLVDCKGDGHCFSRAAATSLHPGRSTLLANHSTFVLQSVRC